MTTTTPESRAQIVYTAYGRAVGFKNHLGEPLPTFAELAEDQRRGWMEGARVLWELATTGHTTFGPLRE